MVEQHDRDAALGSEVMNTAVPGTRGGWRRAMSLRNRSIGSELSRRMSGDDLPARASRSSSAGRRRSAITSGNHPPLATLTRFAPRKARSTDRNSAAHRQDPPARPAPPVARHGAEQEGGDRHGAGDRDAVRGGEAAGRPEREHQQHAGHAQDPVDAREVDLADLGLGRVPDRSPGGSSPSCTACRVSEKAPEISACEATTAATVAITTIGYSAQPGTSE